MFHTADQEDIKAGKLADVYFPLIQGKKIIRKFPTPQAIREYILKQLPHFDL